MSPISPQQEHAVLDTMAVLSFLSDCLLVGQVAPLRREAAEGLGVILRDACDRLASAVATGELLLPEQQG